MTAEAAKTLAEMFAQADECTAKEKADAEIVAAMLRCGFLRVKLLLVQMEEVGVALKHGCVSADTAICWLHDIGATSFMHLPDVVEGEGREVAE